MTTYPTDLTRDSLRPFSMHQYYQGKTVFLTGATGFLGKAILEKLLRSIPSIARIYVLIRPKKDLVPQDRLKNGILNGICCKPRR